MSLTVVIDSREGLDGHLLCGSVRSWEVRSERSIDRFRISEDGDANEWNFVVCIPPLFVFLSKKIMK